MPHFNLFYPTLALVHPQDVGAAGTSGRGATAIDGDRDGDGAGPRGTAGAAGAGADGGAGGGGRGGQQDEEEEGEDGAGAVPGLDPMANMNERQKKMYLLRQQLHQCRKANQSAVVAEKKRQKVRGGGRCLLGVG